jgi:hypothetical protein
MFDVFYSGTKPNLHAHEQQARDLDHARELSGTRYFWWVNYLTDYADHDFLYEPVPWQAEHTHVWPSQHQLNGGTLLCPKDIVTDYNYDHEILKRNRSVPIVAIDHGNGIDFAYDYTSRYISDYLGTLRRVLSRVEEEYVWVANSVCDYSTFDWTWHPSEWQDRMLHVFASNNQQFGDTFYVHVPSFLANSREIKLLEWFDTINFVDNVSVPRYTIPRVEHAYDTHVEAVREYEFRDPIVIFSTGGTTSFEPTVNLWREATKTVAPLTPGASVVIVPREVKNHLRQQIYDYPYIDKNYNRGSDPPLDIVFISNGEPGADFNYAHLLEHHNTVPNRITRVNGINGRVAAYHAAAQASTTAWFFAVFAKLQVDTAFNFAWQPDRLQEAKHYIFHARNPVNGLVYGHQAMIAYNRKLVLANTGTGLDFTLDSAHEVVPILSGTAEYADTAWSAWRTAFRECVKLKCNQDVESEYRLDKWLTGSRDYIPNAEYSRYGAEDAVEYYASVAGSFAELKKSYDWAWLASYAFMRRGLITDQ